MTPTLVFDIETVPDTAGLRRILGLPPDMPDAEVAELAFARRREKTGSDFLPLHVQRVIAIGCLFRDAEGVRVRCLGQPGDPEGRIVQDFFRVIERYTPQLVSWNGSGFDLQVLHYRGLVHGVQAPRYWDQGDDDREFKWNNYLSRYHTRHIDLMDVLAQFQPRANAPLDAMAKLCGFPGKLGMDGSAVAAAIAAGGIDDVRSYCETDVLNTFLVYQRFRLMRGELTAGEYAAEISLAREKIAATGAAHWKAFLAAWDANAKA